MTAVSLGCPPWCVSEHARDVWERALEPDCGVWHLGTLATVVGRKGNAVSVRASSRVSSPTAVPEVFVELDDLELPVSEARALVLMIDYLVHNLEGAL